MKFFLKSNLKIWGVSRLVIPVGANVFLDNVLFHLRKRSSSHFFGLSRM